MSHAVHARTDPHSLLSTDRDFVMSTKSKSKRVRVLITGGNRVGDLRKQQQERGVILLIVPHFHTVSSRAAIAISGAIVRPRVLHADRARP